MRRFDGLCGQSFRARGIGHDVADTTDLAPRDERGGVASWRSPLGPVILILPGQSPSESQVNLFPANHWTERAKHKLHCEG